jgi:hypothetical protein
MKSYFLSPVASAEAASAALSSLMAEANQTWLLKAATGDVLGYFYLPDPDCMTPDWMIVADVSGRHDHSEAEVVLTLEKLKAVLGGVITNAI